MSNAGETCEALIIHGDLVQAAKEQMPGEEKIRSIADFFKVLGDPTRIKIIHALFGSRMCVCDLCAALGMNQPAVSQQLKSLRQAGFVTYDREGKCVYYSLNDMHINTVYEQAFLHIAEKEG